MNKQNKFIVLSIGLGAVFLLGGVLGLDRSIAEYLHRSGLEGLQVFVAGTLFLDTITGKDFSKFLIGLLVSGVAAGLIAFTKTRAIGWSVLFVGAVQLLTTLIAGVSKNLFGRLRPFQLLESGAWDRQWFVDGSSFPSGHTGFYFGLFLPLVFLFPRGLWVLMLVPVFIGIARIDANDHFLSDVAASVIVAGALTLALARLATPRQRSAPSG